MRLLVANRAEIASRVLRTAKRLRIPTLVVYHPIDSDLPFVREADQAICLEAEPPRGAYLDGARLIQIAKNEACTHLHPGYGFLSENAAFVESLEHAGLGFVGPRADSILALGDKQKSKELLRQLQIPLVESFELSEAKQADFERAANQIGYPVLIKPAAGGGGKGMIRVDRPEDLWEAVQSSRRVAQASFQDDRVLLEKYVESARHIEVQVFGDGEGKILALGERECSLQRRHQKLVEESPCRFLSPEVRLRLMRESEKLATHLKYRSAGTLEWLWDGSDQIYFLEMNTRLQVEHPVTEETFGIDLVEWQLKLALHQEFPERVPEQKNHSIEVRLCAEDPAQEFLPSGGKIYRLDLPEEVRADFGYRTGNIVSSEFDSLLGKLISVGETRKEATEILLRALEGLVCVGPKTNRAYLIQILKSNAFERGEISTQFLSAFPAQFDYLEAIRWIRQLGATGPGQNVTDPDAETEDLDLYSPWGGCGQNNQEADWWADFDGRRYFFPSFADWSEEIGPAKAVAETESSSDQTESEIRSPMPSKILKISCSEGEVVSKGRPLISLEAMKMEHQIRAKRDCVVKRIFVSEGQQVLPESVLLELGDLDGED
ncbi:MAG: ATP-grasp domain-containing protein [Bradymonadales bacterium]|nr:MAG: ATP-grasp domain-containing protein [Bradymonadales bacterium]